MRLFKQNRSNDSRFFYKIFYEDLSAELQDKYSWYDRNPIEYFSNKMTHSHLTSENPIVFDRIADTLAKAFKLNKERVKKILSEKIQHFVNISSGNEKIFIHDFLHYLLDRYFFDKIEKNNFDVDDYVKEIIVTYLTFTSRSYALIDFLRLLSLTGKKIYSNFLSDVFSRRMNVNFRGNISFADIVKDLEFLKTKAKTNLSKRFLEQLISKIKEYFSNDLSKQLRDYYNFGGDTLDIQEFDFGNDLNSIFKSMDIIPKGLVERIKKLMNLLAMQ